ncbi:DNA-directed RNA polymerase III subunit RPC3 [Cryptotermes secundus]|uniref:DNA-directed RNA polymerase III subunit RPC3 n=1 Tax=Cryptotermes secundus TaxID=105785 RepID=A0A2J7PPT7_9NEOP|nr:DNA-directed RNA polymerase III subunit RPC3 isoform X1 [Cryptotermes secundus]PNF18354.1 DNA-directed RNA polymerase III subunit RPC3 [Cryptotermes secundus]
MSLQFEKLCSLILLEHFGEIIQKVGNDLYKCQSKPLNLIVGSTKLPFQKVKQALRIMIQYGFVTFAEGQFPDKAEYTLLADKVILLLRYPRYLLLMKTQYGDEAEMLVEEILRRGQDTASSVIIRAATRLKESLKVEKVCLVTLHDKFSVLVNKQFLMRCPSPDEEKGVPVLTIKEKLLYLPPELNLKGLADIEEGKPGDPGDGGIYWRVNFDRFHQDFRDQIMVSAISRRCDDNAGELLKELLKQMYLRTEAWAATSNPVPFTELREAVRKQSSRPLLGQYIEQYLKVMEEDSSGFVSKVGDSSGGQYSINMKTAFVQLTWATIENIVMERFGSKGARIFRLVRAKKFVEQEQIQQVAMIPAKEAKLLTYRLLEENFLHIQELRKSLANNVPNKTFFLFHIDLNQVARMVLEMCYKALYNAMVRREHERSENRRMVEKQQRIESITLTMREQGATAEQLAEIEEMLTPPEQALLEKVRTMINKLSEAELQLDETMFILQLYLSYQV